MNEFILIALNLLWCSVFILFPDWDLHGFHCACIITIIGKAQGQILLIELYTLDRKDSVLYMRFILLEVLIPLDDEYFFAYLHNDLPVYTPSHTFDNLGLTMDTCYFAVSAFG